MNNADFSRLGRKVVQYFWDPEPKNEDAADIWCLGRRYDSRYQANRQPTASTPPSSPPAKSPAVAPVSKPRPSSPIRASSGLSQTDLGVVTLDPSSTESAPNGASNLPDKTQDGSDSRKEAEDAEAALGWPPEFLDDLESRVWLTYRNNFPPIPRINTQPATTPTTSSALSFSTKIRNLGNALQAQATGATGGGSDGFTSDTGWGCMIRSGQSLLANSLEVLYLGRDWRRSSRTEEGGAKDDQEKKHRNTLAWFADSPEAPFSIHKFVDHGAKACGKHPGEWFGPSATARSLQYVHRLTTANRIR